VFILCRSPPVVALLGLTGAYIGSGSVYCGVPILPYPLSCCGPLGLVAVFAGGNGGNAQSRFNERSSGEGGTRSIGAVALRVGLPNDDRRPSLGVIGDALRDGEALTGVS
jgi:hypothetical protein